MEQTLSNKHVQKFWRNVIKTDTCWIWKASSNYGYGTFRIGKKLARAHRVSYSLANGAIPKGKLIMHSCDNPPCVNPSHLSTGTHLENARDRERRGRHTPLFGERNIQAKLEEGEVKVIREMYGRGIKQKVLAALFNVGQDNISRIVNYKIWNHKH